jgi:serine/threonine-protein kinase HipA
LLFSYQEAAPILQDGSIEFADIAAAIDEAGQLEESIDVATADLRHLLACGSSAGGARPKVLTAQGGDFWIAKFASRKDLHPELAVALEETGLTLAGLAGLTVPAFKRQSVGGRGVLLIQRFDMTPKSGRNALVSFRTLIGIEDQYAVSYSDLASMIRRFSCQPLLDLELLYRQMIVNVLLVNTDDHLQNFAMLHTEQGWRLSPAYDIVPNIYQTEQILQVNGKHTGLRFADILLEGQSCGLSRQRSKQILLDVLARISAEWQGVFAACLVPEAHTGRLKNHIHQGLERMKSDAAA